MAYSNDKNDNNNNNNNHHDIAANIFTITVMMVVAISMATNPAAAATITTHSTNSTTSSTATRPSSSVIHLSVIPIQQERIRTTSQTSINQTHLFITYTGNGTVSPSNTTKTINITANGSAIVSIIAPLSLYGKETIRTEDGQTATSTFYEIVQVNPATREGKGITMAITRTNSTGTLAPLNGTIGVGVDNIDPNGEEAFTIWKWESGISNNSDIDSTGIATGSASPIMQGSPG